MNRVANRVFGRLPYGAGSGESVAGSLNGVVVRFGPPHATTHDFSPRLQRYDAILVKGGANMTQMWYKMTFNVMFWRLV